MNEEPNGIAPQPASVGTLVNNCTVLLHAARQGDNRALEELCLHLRSYLSEVVTHQLGGRLRAKVAESDIIQQTMLDACRSFADFRGNTEEQLKAWVKQALQHNIIDASRRFHDTQRRQASRERRLDSRLASPSIVDSQTASRIVSRQESDAELLKALERLPQQQQRVIEMRHRYGMTYAQIATRLGITEVAARKCWSRAVATLARELSVDHEY